MTIRKILVFLQIILIISCSQQNNELTNSQDLIRDCEFVYGIEVCKITEFDTADGGYFIFYEVSGLKEAVMKKFDKDSSLMFSANYKNDTLNGDFILYENGMITQTGEYLKGKRSGKWLQFNEGKLGIESFYVDSKDSIPTREWSKEGKIAKTYVLVNDMSQGPMIVYNET